MPELNDDSFTTAADNMRFDEQLLQSCIDDAEPYFIRFYLWQQKGLTQAHKREIPSALSELDQSRRLTGGGLVFHSPGDIVFSLAIKRSVTSKPIKTILQSIAEEIHSQLCAFSIPAVMASSDDAQSKRDIRFCAAYFSPYEVYVGDSKVLGVAAKRTKDVFFFQGVLHLQATETYFEDFKTNYGHYFSKGCQLVDDNSVAIKEALLSSFSDLFASLSDLR